MWTAIILVIIYLVIGFVIALLFASLTGQAEKIRWQDIVYWTFLWAPLLIKSRMDW